MITNVAIKLMRTIARMEYMIRKTLHVILLASLLELHTLAKPVKLF